MSKELNIISKSEVLLLKGIAIFLIVMHNFFHWVDPIFGENEFSFNPKNINNFLDLVLNNKIDFIHATFALIGHYGVQIFIFCSAYGLTIKYKYNIESKLTFYKQRTYKLYPTFTIAIIFLVAYNHLVLDYSLNLTTAKLILLRYSLLANLIPGKAFIVNGPFWFYSMIFQFYIAFPFLLKLVNKRITIAYLLIPLFLVVNILFNDLFDSYKFSLYYNLIGNMPVLLFGMIATRFNVRLFKNWIIIGLSFAVFIAGQFYDFVWYFSQLAFLFFSIPLILKLFNISKSNKTTNLVLHIGRISMYIFAIHGFLRIPWVTNSISYSSSIYVNIVAYIVVVYAVALSTKLIETKVIKYLNKITLKS